MIRLLLVALLVAGCVGPQAVPTSPPQATPSVGPGGGAPPLPPESTTPTQAGGAPTIDPIPALKGAVANLTGSVPAGEGLVLVLRHGNLSFPLQATVVGGRWMAVATPPFGDSALTATSSAGLQASANVTRLAQGWLAVKYTAQPTRTNTNDTVWFDVDHYGSWANYTNRDVHHPPHYTVHDFMRVWQNATGAQVAYAYSSGLGYAPIQFNGVGNPAGLGSTTPPWWCYKVDGANANLGISLEGMNPGDSVTWEYSTCA
ncbi:MAG: hypothetical protein ACYDBQ_03080 [Thermoplasmatota archaeon]